MVIEQVSGGVIDLRHGQLEIHLGLNKVEFSLGKLAAEPEPSAKPLYACRINNSEDHMTSPSSTCEGQTVLGTLGYILTAKPADTPSLPLYRCLFNGTHFDSNDANCEGYKQEFQFGWTVQ